MKKRQYKKTRAQRFWEKVNKTDTCWLWTGALAKGHGRFQSDDGIVQAHRWSWEQSNPPVPIGLVLDHKCNNKECVNPEHLTITTASANTARYYNERAYCKNGHSLAGEGTLVRGDGTRLCRECNRQRAAKHRNGTYWDKLWKK